MDVARGLHYLHRRGIIHFDLKSNSERWSVGGCLCVRACVGVGGLH